MASLLPHVAIINHWLPRAINTVMFTKNPATVLTNINRGCPLPDTNEGVKKNNLRKPQLHMMRENSLKLMKHGARCLRGVTVVLK